MREARLKFEREGLEGIIPVGSYLADAAGRFGVRFEEKCVPSDGLHYCRITVIEGVELLTETTEAEQKVLSENERTGGIRLACQVRVDAPGEIVVMTEKEEKRADVEGVDESIPADYSKAFAELPLEKKIAELVRLEAIALSDTFTFIFNSPYLVFDKAMDVLAEFGMKKEDRSKRDARPAEHQDAAATEDQTSSSTQGPKEKRKQKESETGIDI